MTTVDGAQVGLAGMMLSSLPALSYARPMDRETDDSSLMEQYRAGDTAAFEVLYRRNKDRLYRYLLRLCPDRDAVEDVFQEAWGKVIGARDAYRPKAAFRTYLFHVAHNCFVDYLRRNRRHQHGPGPDPDLEMSPGPEPDVLAEHALLRRKLARALEDLPVEQREAWLLQEEAGLSTDQVASVTGVNRETAKSRVRYATRKLKASLDARSAAPAPAGLGKVGTS